MSDLTTTNPAPVSILNIIAQAATDPAVEGVYGHARKLACRVWTAMCAAAPNPLGRAEK